MNSSVAIAAIVCAILCPSAATADAKFSTESVTQTASAAVSETTGRSDIECAAKCLAVGSTSCSATVFVPETQACKFSGARNADFANAAVGKPVYRRTLEVVNASYAQVGDKLFRVIQHRSKGVLSFQRNWTEYENGFGDDTDFWIGLETINSMTGSTPRLLRVEAVTWANILFVGEYSGFSVGSASTNYTMTFASYLTASSNMSSDSLTYHRGWMFSTIDVDNDARATSSCSQTLGGFAGWWFNSCLYSNPNGIYYPSAVIDSERAMHWVGADARKAVKSIRLMLQV